ncbi:hypothetical protein BpHYR1_013704 [Brachionus plicatilis]|uniref:Uncharacterized protein n=1 Tax=Brachionus plicatilis TaxID=10195 RepID=A0A3M7RMS3_BRAPC|nr:hypothetical protein BpHYR1_013704 [Brachionus plicatilis]
MEELLLFSGRHRLVVQIIRHPNISILTWIINPYFYNLFLKDVPPSLVAYNKTNMSYSCKKFKTFQIILTED